VELLVVPNVLPEHMHLNQALLNVLIVQREHIRNQDMLSVYPVQRVRSLIQSNLESTLVLLVPKDSSLAREHSFALLVILDIFHFKDQAVVRLVSQEHIRIWVFNVLIVIQEPMLIIMP